MSFNIIGTGSSFPEKVITNDDLTNIMDTSDEWIKTRTGISERHILTKETLSAIAHEAAKQALISANTDPMDIDLIICSTLQGDYITPPLSCVVQGMLNMRCPAFDINVACPGFIYALDIAAGYFARGKAKKILVLSAEAMSRHMNWEERATCVLFGDGASAVVLEKGEGLLSIKLTAQGLVDYLVINGSRGNCPYTSWEGEHYPYLVMNGTEVYKFAVSSICADLTDVIREAGLTTVDHVLPHQANMRIINTAAAKLNIPRERWHTNIDRYGNTSSVTIPSLLDELIRAGEIKPGETVAMTAFGGGLTTGACVMRF